MATTNNPKELEGAKKPPFAHVPTTALRQQAAAHQVGAVKYGHLNYRSEGIDTATYYNAAMRHLLAWREAVERAHTAGADIARLTDEQRLEFGFDENDEQAGIRCSHMGYLMADAGVIEDAMVTGQIVDTLGRPEVKQKTGGKASNAALMVDPSKIDLAALDRTETGTLDSTPQDDEDQAEYVPSLTPVFKFGDRVRRKDGVEFTDGRGEPWNTAKILIKMGGADLVLAELGPFEVVLACGTHHFKADARALERVPKEGQGAGSVIEIKIPSSAPAEAARVLRAAGWVARPVHGGLMFRAPEDTA